MTIAQALKEKNKKVANIQKLWQRISQYNSVVEGTTRPYDVEKAWEEYCKEIAALVELKTQIHAASAPVRHDIFLLSEIKSQLNTIRSLNVTTGRFRDRYAEETLQMTSIFGVEWKDQSTEELEAKIEQIQEKLDKFNHSVSLSV